MTVPKTTEPVIREAQHRYYVVARGRDLPTLKLSDVEGIPLTSEKVAQMVAKDCYLRGYTSVKIKEVDRE